MGIVATRGGLSPVLVAQSFAAVVRSSTNGVVTNDTDYQVIGTVNVTGMRANSKLVVVSDWDFTNSANVKWIATDWGGSNIAAPSYTTNASVKLMIEICNANSLSAQKIMNASTFATAYTAAHTSATKDTSGTVAIDFKVKWGANVASETITLVGYSVWHYPA